MTEKCLEHIQLHLPETLYRDVLDEATQQDLATSAFIRKVLTQYLYGAKGKRDTKRYAEDRS